VDAQYGAVKWAIVATSATPGHAMKVGEPLQAFGTVIGKALRPLKAAASTHSHSDCAANRRKYAKGPLKCGFKASSVSQAMPAPQVAADFDSDVVVTLILERHMPSPLERTDRWHKPISCSNHGAQRGQRLRPGGHADVLLWSFGHDDTKQQNFWTKMTIKQSDSHSYSKRQILWRRSPIGFLSRCGRGGFTRDGVASDFGGTAGWCGTFGPVWMDFLFSLERTEGNYDMSQAHLLQIAYAYYDVLSPEALDRLILVLLAKDHIHRPGDDDILQVAARRMIGESRCPHAGREKNKNCGKRENHVSPFYCGIAYDSAHRALWRHRCTDTQKNGEDMVFGFPNSIFSDRREAPALAQSSARRHL